MRIFLILIALVFITTELAKGHDLKPMTPKEKVQRCGIRYIYQGIYHEACPRGMVVSRVNVQHHRSNFSPLTRVECLALQIVCRLDEEKDLNYLPLDYE